MKHRFAKKSGANPHPVEAAGKLPFTPNLQGMGVSRPMHTKVALNHCLVDPGVAPVTAGAHNPFESRVDAHLPSGIPQRLFRAMRDVKGIERNNTPGVRRKAANRTVPHCHREPAGAIEAQEFLGRNESCHRLSALLSMFSVRCVTLFFCLLAAAALAGCSVAEQDVSDVGETFERGIKGEGRIVPNDPTRDAFGPEFQ